MCMFDVACACACLMWHVHVQTCPSGVRACACACASADLLERLEGAWQLPSLRRAIADVAAAFQTMIPFLRLCACLPTCPSLPIAAQHCPPSARPPTCPPAPPARQYRSESPVGLSAVHRSPRDSETVAAWRPIGRLPLPWRPLAHSPRPRVPGMRPTARTT